MLLIFFFGGGEGGLLFFLWIKGVTFLGPHSPLYHSVKIPSLLSSADNLHMWVTVATHRPLIHSPIYERCGEEWNDKEVAEPRDQSQEEDDVWPGHFFHAHVIQHLLQWDKSLLVQMQQTGLWSLSSSMIHTVLKHYLTCQDQSLAILCNFVCK